MDQKQLHKLRRSDLFELLVAQAQEIERLQEQNAELQQQLQKRDIQIENAGSIAEAALALNEVFEAAQAAADHYLENVKILAEQQKELK